MSATETPLHKLCGFPVTLAAVICDHDFISITVITVMRFTVLSINMVSYFSSTFGYVSTLDVWSVTYHILGFLIGLVVGWGPVLRAFYTRINVISNQVIGVFRRSPLDQNRGVRLSRSNYLSGSWGHTWINTKLQFSLQSSQSLDELSCMNLFYHSNGS